MWSFESLLGFSIRATDRIIGRVHDLYFDDSSWTVRYLVADTSRWLFGRRVLIASAALEPPDVERKAFPVQLTSEQIKDSPPVDTDKPVSRRHESLLHRFYGWPPYWGHPGMAQAGLAAGMVGWSSADKVPEPPPPPEDAEEGDPHLRSAREVRGYHIAASDGAIGHVDDLLIDREGWRIRYLVVDTRNWLPGRKVMLSPDWVSDIDWASREVVVSQSRDQIERSPEYDPDRTVERSYEERLYRHYGTIPYW